MAENKLRKITINDRSCNNSSSTISIKYFAPENMNSQLIIWMIYYVRINVSEGFHFNNINTCKEYSTFLYRYFLNLRFRF